MKIMPYTEARPRVYDSGEMKGTTARVVIGKADGANHFCMRVFELSEGAVSHHHAHPFEHEVFVHAGRGEILCEGAWVPVKKGDIIFIPENETHQLRNFNPDPLVFVCLIPSSAPEL